MNRRSFTKKSLLACCGFVAGTTILESCSSIKTLALSSESSVLSVSFAEIGEQTAFFIKSDLTTTPIYLYKEGTTWHAVLMECTHVQCELKLKKDIFVCPCHGSKFTTSGEVLTGPAKLSLETIKVEKGKDGLVLRYL